MRRTLIVDNHIYFREDMNYLEDILYYMHFGINAKRVAVIDHYCYYYRIRSNSISHDIMRLKRHIEASKIFLPAAEVLRRNDPKYDYTIRVNMARQERTNEMALPRILDSIYVKQTLAFYKNNGFYPHDISLKAKMLEARGAKYKILYRLLRIEPCFWAIHYAYKLLAKAKSLLKSK